MKKTLLVLSLMTGCPVFIQADWKTNFEYGMQTIVKPNALVIFPTALIIAKGILNRNNKNGSFALHNTPERVTEFCHKRLAYHDIDPKSVCIKMTYMAPNALALYSHTILFSNSLALEFDQALANPDDATNAAIIGRYSTILDHEISHMKHNDVVNRLTFMGVITGAFVAAQQAIIHTGYAPWFTNKLEDTILGINKAKYAAVNLISNLAFIALSLEASNWYTRSIERSADEFAIQHAQTSSSLREMAQWLSAQEKLNLQWVLITGQLMPTGFIGSFRQVSLRNKLLTEYINEKHAGNSAAQNTQEFWDGFATWVIECRPDDANFFMKTLFASADHPSADERSKRLNQAADELEQKLL